MKKRLFSLLLAVLLVITVMPFTSFAEDTGVDVGTMYNMQLQVESAVVGTEDDTVVLSVKLVRNGGFAGISCQLMFDSSVLTLKDSPELGEIDGIDFVAGPSVNGRQLLQIMSLDGENVYGDGVLVTYTFSINPEAKAGKYDVQLIVNGVAELPDGETVDLEILDENREALASHVVNGTVTVKGYTISYDANGGSGAPESIEKSKNVDVFISSNEPVRNGYSFLGWSTDKNATSAEYKAGDKFSTNKDTVLYAVWKKLEAIAGTVDISVSTVEGKAGEAVEAIISVANHPGMESLQFDVVFDDTRLKYVSAELVRQDDEEITLDEFMFVAPNPDAVTNKMTIGLTTGVKNLVGDGDLLKIKFNVLEEAEDGFADISVASVEAYKLIDLNKDEKATVVPNVTNGGVELVSQLLGDVNLDETVDMNDAILLLQYSLFPDDYPIDYKGSVDFTKDGNIDMNDAILLLQYSLFPEDYPIG